MSLGLVKNLADEVYRMLHLIGMSGLLALNDDSCANNTRGSDDVDQ